MSDDIDRQIGSKRMREPLLASKDPTARDRQELYEFGSFRLEAAERNVWSAASPQAKCEDVPSWSAQMYTAFIGVNHSWPGWNALRSFPH
jgi:hypothetical protein